MINSSSTAATPRLCFDHSMPANRFISYNDRDEILIYADGSCLNNGQDSPRAGCGFVYRPFANPAGVLVRNGGFSFRLETRGPDGITYPQTNNRAELRAVIAALDCNAWEREGWLSLVIASDSDYVVSGITQWIRLWERNGWVTSTGHEVMNRDLWGILKRLVDEYVQSGIKVSFWRIPRELNSDADVLAKYGASLEEVDQFVKIRI